jgi:hypothetical protein
LRTARDAANAVASIKNIAEGAQAKASQADSAAAVAQRTADTAGSGAALAAADALSAWQLAKQTAEQLAAMPGGPTGPTGAPQGGASPVIGISTPGNPNELTIAFLDGRQITVPLKLDLASLPGGVAGLLPAGGTAGQVLMVNSQGVPAWATLTPGNGGTSEVISSAAFAALQAAGTVDTQKVYLVIP